MQFNVERFITQPLQPD